MLTQSTDQPGEPTYPIELSAREAAILREILTRYLGGPSKYPSDDRESIWSVLQDLIKIPA